jgi:dUTPase
MQLTGPGAVREGLVVQTSEVKARPASVDLSVGVVVINGKEFKQPVEIKPQQMFVIISKERVQVGAGFVGYAMPKTSLCNEGILCLNTGILDPGYEGLISTTAINFVEDSYLITPGEHFLRLVFHRLEPEDAAASGQADLPLVLGEPPVQLAVPLDSTVPKPIPEESTDAAPPPGPAASERTSIELKVVRPAATDSNRIDAAYIKEAKSHSRRFPDTFLNIPGQIETITERVLGRQNTLMITTLTIFTIIFVLWNIGGYMLLGTQVSDIARARADLEQVQRQLDSARTQTRVIRAAICALPRLPAIDTVGKAKTAAARTIAGCA